MPRGRAFAQGIADGGGADQLSGLLGGPRAKSNRLDCPWGDVAEVAGQHRGPLDAPLLFLLLGEGAAIGGANFLGPATEAYHQLSRCRALLASVGHADQEAALPALSRFRGDALAG